MRWQPQRRRTLPVKARRRYWSVSGYTPTSHAVALKDSLQARNQSFVFMFNITASRTRTLLFADLK